jgi:hypothetical protein
MSTPVVDPVASYGLPQGPGVGRLSTLRGMRHTARLLAALNGFSGADGCGNVAAFLANEALSSDARTMVCAALAAMLAHHSRARRAELHLPLKPSLEGLAPSDVYAAGAAKPTATVLQVQGGAVVAFHGTGSKAEALVDFSIGMLKPVEFGPAVRALAPDARVPPELERGLVAPAAWHWFSIRGGFEAVRQAVAASSLFVGHSLGAVTATLAAAVALCLSRGAPVSLVTIGPPRAYDRTFCQGLQKHLRSSYHIANVRDVVPALRGLHSLCSCCPSVVVRASARSPDLAHDLVHYTYSLALFGTSPATLLAPCCAGGAGPGRVTLAPFGSAAVASAEARCPASGHAGDDPVLSSGGPKMSRRL